MTDLDPLLPAIAAGDALAFGRWVAGSEARIRLSLSRFAAAVDTEVVVQETLLRVWQTAPRVEPDGRANCLLRFAIRVARNYAIDLIRLEGRQPRATEDEALQRQADADAPTPVPPDPLLRKALVACREKLPAKPAQAFSARLEAHGVQHDRDLAAQLGMKLNTFLKNVGRARALLADCLRRAGVELGGAR